MVSKPSSYTGQNCLFSSGREIIYLSLHCHHQNDSCIKTGSDESHFNVSLTARDKSDKTVSTWRWGDTEVGVSSVTSFRDSP